MQERAGLQASTSGRAAVPALKHRHARGLLLRHHRVVRHAKRSGDDGQSFNPKDMEELKNLMPDPQQDSLFDDLGSDAAQLLDDDDDLFASLGKSFEGKPFADTFAAAQSTPLPDLSTGPKTTDFGVLSLEERQAVKQAEKMLNLQWEARAFHMRHEMTMDAIASHHRVMNNARNRYQTALELASLIEQFELNPPEDEHPDFPIPSWVRAYAVLDHQTVDAQTRYEQRVEETERLVQEHGKRAKIANMLARPVVDVDAIATTAATPVHELFAEEPPKMEGLPADRASDPLDAFLLDILPDLAAAQQQPNILTLPDQHSSSEDEWDQEAWLDNQEHL